MSDLKSIKDDYLAVFFGKQQDYYLEVANRFREGDKIVFNFAAFLFGLFWMLYRRMYLYSFLLILAIMGLTLLENYIFATFFPGLKGDSGSLISNLIMGILMGCFANRLYLHHVQRQITRILAEETNEEAIYDRLERKGGVTLVPFIIILSLILGMLIVARFFPAAVQ